MLQLFGKIEPPPGIKEYIAKSNEQGGAIFFFINNILKLLGIIAGIYAVIQIIMAGYTYISATGDTKKTELAWNMIWQSLLGLLVVATAFTIAAVVGNLLGIKILEPAIYGPN